MQRNETILVFGATGNVGGTLSRELLRRGWRVRGVTRNPQSEKAQAVAALGAEIVQADMDDRPSLEAAFAGIERVFSVQTWMESGIEGEMRQGKLVADVARDAGVKHLVYGSAGNGDRNTGIAHFDNKLVVEAYMHDLGLPVTVVRPAPFMELMTQKDFYPALGTWGTMTRIVPWDLPYPWVAVEDIGIAIANIFDRPDEWIGGEIETLMGDVKSLGACRQSIKEVTGRKPFRIPFPVALFEKFVGKEMVEMWHWAVQWIEASGPETLWSYVEASRRVHPEMQSVETWLQRSQSKRPARIGRIAVELSR